MGYVKAIMSVRCGLSLKEITVSGEVGWNTKRNVEKKRVQSELFKKGEAKCKSAMVMVERDMC